MVISQDQSTPSRLPDNRLVWAVIRLCLLGGLAYCVYLAGCQGISAWFLRQNSSSALESAVRWDPKNPQNFDDLGTLTHMYADGSSPDRIVSAYQEATRLSPQNALYWANLGAAYDWAGRKNDAAAAFQHAQQLFPKSPDINWRVANFDVREGRTTEALQSLRKVLVSGGVAHREVFALAATTTRDNKAILGEALPSDSSILLDFLNFRVLNDDIGSAEEVWQRLLELNLAFPLRDALPYLDGLIRHRELAELQEAWLALATRFPEEIPSRSPETNLILNGSFEHEILNGGFDWRIVPVKGAQVSLDEENRFEAARSLRIDFDSTENPYYWHVFQYVRVEPGTRYHFSGYMRVKGITSDSGPAFEIYDAYDMQKLYLSGDSLIGTSDWSLQQFHFNTPPNTDLLVVRVGRRPGQKLANKIGGTVWVDKISLKIEN
jgi:hypothetical protein